MKKFKCKVCGYVHEGDEPPEKCPVCQALKKKFEEMTEDDEQGNTDLVKIQYNKILKICSLQIFFLLNIFS